MKKIGLIVVFLITANITYSQNLFDLLFPKWEDGIMPGIDFHLQNLITTENDNRNIEISPSIAGLKTFDNIGILDSFGVFAEIGSAINTYPEFIPNFYFDIKSTVFIGINEKIKANVLLGSKSSFSKNFAFLSEQINLNLCLSGNSENSFLYYIGLDNDIDFNIEDDTYLYELNPYMIFKTVRHINMGLKYNVISSYTTVESNTGEGSILRWIKLKAEYEHERSALGLELTVSPIRILDTILTITPYGHIKIGNIYGFIDFEFSLIKDGGISFGANIGLKYNVKKL
ncbi:MAG: hypothetical protein FWG27_05015 [Treponema sp.]|nr:hypothetical protein [Treponema sp.]